MLIRIISTFTLLGMMGSGYSSADSDADDEEKMGGEGFGRVVGFVAFISVVILAVVLVLAVLSLTGQFESELADPVT